MKKLLSAALAATLISFSSADALACTNMLVGKKASVNGATMISYNADSHTLYGELYFTPAADHAPGAMRKVIEWDTNKPLGEIPQPAHTYRVVGNVNEWQVTIAESTWGGRHRLSDKNGIIDYGSLIYIALERSKTAREAIDVMTSLVSEYGYYSSGETFSIGDPNEIWVMDLVGKGTGNTGAVWVAQRIPDDCISAHANQARIHKFPQAKKKLNKKMNRYEVGDSCMFSADLIPFGRTLGYEGSDADFDFAATFGDLDYSAFRGCDGRVWAFFNRYASGMERYFDFVDMVEGAEVLPLYVKPDRLLSHRDIQDALGDHFEGTPWDMTKDVGGGPFHCPYRWRPMHFEVDGVTYTHERAIGTQQTGFSFVAEMRGWLPREVGAKTWFAADDAATAIFMPIYNNILEAPLCLRVGNGDMLTFSWTSAFWMTNWVANQCYSRYEDMKVDVDRVRNKIMDRWDAETDSIDAQAVALLKNSTSDVTAFLNEYTARESNGATEAYKDLGIYLLVKYLDGNIKQEKDGEFARTPYGMADRPQQPKYSEEFYRAIVNQIGDKIKVKK
ncbi:MAG: C69 family dipeptidase [Bacteroidales bacterium]|nr:C69 family dipeptidase [Bacteroidales bacterium]